MLALHLCEPLSCLVQGRLPGDGPETVSLAALRLADPVGIILDVEDCGGLRADVPAAEGIVGIAAHRARVEIDGEAADRLAEHAGVEVLGHGESPAADLSTPFRGMLTDHVARNRYRSRN